MIQWIVKYWVQVIFGLVVGGLGFLCKKFFDLYITDIKNNMIKEIQKQAVQITKDQEENVAKLIEINKTDIRSLMEENNSQNAKIANIYNGVINLQAVSFKCYCRKLLDENYNMTLADFENCQHEYQVYTSLGGNGQGTILYNLVCEKAKNLVQQKEKQGTN